MVSAGLLNNTSRDKVFLLQGSRDLKLFDKGTMAIQLRKDYFHPDTGTIDSHAQKEQKIKTSHLSQR